MASSEDLEKFHTLYFDSMTDVSHYVFTHARVEDAKDILQNIYIEIYRNVDKCENPSYIMGIAKNKVKDYYRFRYKNQFVSLFYKDVEIDVPDDFDLEKTVNNKYDADRVWKYLKRKPTYVGQIFYLYYYKQWTLKEVGKGLNMNESTIKSILYRTLKELRKYMEEVYEDNTRNV